MDWSKALDLGLAFKNLRQDLIGDWDRVPWDWRLVISSRDAEDSRPATSSASRPSTELRRLLSAADRARSSQVSDRRMSRRLGRESYHRKFGIGGRKSNGDDGNQVFESGEVSGVAGVEPGAVRVGGGGYEQVHDPTPGLTAGINDRSRKTAITDRY